MHEEYKISSNTEHSSKMNGIKLFRTRVYVCFCHWVRRHGEEHRFNDIGPLEKRPRYNYITYHSPLILKQQQQQKKKSFAFEEIFFVENLSILLSLWTVEEHFSWTKHFTVPIIAISQIIACALRNRLFSTLYSVQSRLSWPWNMEIIIC